MNYTTSKDYELLWNLVQEGKKIVCFVRDVEGAQIAKLDQGIATISMRNRGLMFTQSRLLFIQQCANFNLEFLPPDEWVKIESDKDLPPDGQSVECVFRGKEVSHASWDKCLNKWDNGDYYWAKEDITHWMPLPEAPKE